MEGLLRRRCLGGVWCRWEGGEGEGVEVEVQLQRKFWNGTNYWMLIRYKLMFATLLNTQTYINKLSHQGLYLCVCGFLYYVLVFFSLDNIDL